MVYPKEEEKEMHPTTSPIDGVDLRNSGTINQVFYDESLFSTPSLPRDAVPPSTPSAASQPRHQIHPDPHQTARFFHA